MPETVEEIHRLVEQIDRFDEESRRAQHADTEKAWELLRRAGRVLRRATKDLNAAYIALNRVIEFDDRRTCLYCDKDEWGPEAHGEGCPLRLAYIAVGDVDA